MVYLEGSVLVALLGIVLCTMRCVDILYVYNGQSLSVLFLALFHPQKGKIYCSSDWRDFFDYTRMEETVLFNMGSALLKVSMKVLMVFQEE